MKIEKIDNEINRLNGVIEKNKKKLDVLVEKKKEEEVKSVMNLLNEKGLNANDLAALLNKNTEIKKEVSEGEKISAEKM